MPPTSIEESSISMNSVRTSIVLPEKALREVDELAEADKTTRSEIIRRSISVYRQLRAAEQEEGKVLVLMPKQRLKSTPAMLVLVET